MPPVADRRRCGFQSQVAHYEAQIKQLHGTIEKLQQENHLTRQEAQRLRSAAPQPLLAAHTHAWQPGP